jgi:hypothetical protein
MVLEGICADLEAGGYEVQPCIIPAGSLGNWQLRKRLWILAHLNRFGQFSPEFFPETYPEPSLRIPPEWEQFHFVTRGKDYTRFRDEDQHRICRDYDGVSFKLLQQCVHALGNSIVPQNAEMIFHTIRFADFYFNLN